MELIISCVLYGMIGIGAAIGTVRKEDGNSEGFLVFFLAFFFWPIFAGFKLTHVDED